MAKRSLTEMVQLTARVPRGHEGFWAIILELDGVGPWTLRQLDEQTNVNRASSKDYVHRLERGGFAERVGEVSARSGVANATLWRLLKKPIEAPRLDRHGNELEETSAQLLWRSIRILKTFTCRELQAAAEMPERPVALATARHYVAALSDVGVVSAPPTRAPTEWTYRLLRDVGPKAPSVSSALVVFDPNSRQVLGEPEIRVMP
ncbi:hypothetical protein [Devosia sp.]|uniref:hypothetical protein n=1 Tax=Devosia sp. TaxID=1871048 RepID=UPI001AC3AF2A|nr:hypothetical protein [Devosia sp.]MBN9334683.1 hypothetical protein [Devosia sp.]